MDLRRQDSGFWVFDFSGSIRQQIAELNKSAEHNKLFKKNKD